MKLKRNLIIILILFSLIVFSVGSFVIFNLFFSYKKDEISTAVSTLPNKKIITDHFKWGLEYWNLGQHQFPIQINANSPILVKSIQGYVTASAMPQSLLKNDPSLERQSLITLTYENIDNKNLHILSEQKNDGTYNESLDRNIFSQNIKQTGQQTKEIPIQYYFGNGVQIPNNKLILNVVNNTYGYNTDKLFYKSQNPTDALDIEIHITVEYEAIQ